MGYLLLEGGAEFGGGMREPDLKAMQLAGGFDVPVRIIPTAAAPDHNHGRAGNNGVRWFQSLGAKDVTSVPLIDKASADDEKIAQSLRDAKLIYLLGGFTHYLGGTLKGSRAWDAALEAYRSGAVVAGSSAGAMVMCGLYYDPGAGRVHEGVGSRSECARPAASRYLRQIVGAEAHEAAPRCDPDRYRRRDRHDRRRRKQFMDRVRARLGDLVSKKSGRNSPNGEASFAVKCVHV